MRLEGEKKTFELLVEANWRSSRKANLALGDEVVSLVSFVSFEIDSGDLRVNGHGMAASGPQCSRS